MFNHEIFAVTFGRTVDLLRKGAPPAQQKAALRAVYALTSVASAMLRVYQDMLTVDDVGIPDTLDFIPGLIQRMREHGVAEIAVAKDAEPAELLALARGLASEAVPEGGAQGLKRRLRKVRSTRVMVIPAPADEEGAGHRAPSVTQAFESEAVEEQAASDRPSGAAAAPLSGTEDYFELSGQLIELPPEPAAPLASAPPPPPPPPAAPPSSLAVPAAPVQGPAAPVPQLSGVISGGTPLGAALADVAADPFGPDILQRLTALGKQIERALVSQEIEPAVHALAAVVAWEPESPEGSVRNAYGIVLRRTLTRDALQQLARHVGDPRLGTELAKVVPRGHDAVEVLLDLLTGAETIKQRKAYMTVLRTIPEGFDGVVHMLEDGRWFVVRNVAELMGEHRIAEAVPDLEKCLAHGDPRVRRAAAIALAKIGTPATVEPLRRLLKSGDPELRPLVAASIGGPGSRGLAMPLVALAEQEEDVGVVKEYYLALGRIGTPDAVKALTLAAKPGGKLLGRRPAAPRAAAVEGLRIAGGRSAAAALEALVDDADKGIREAARAALDEVRARAAVSTS